MEKTINKVNEDFKIGVLDYLKYERDERVDDMDDDDFISPLDGFSDLELMFLIDIFTLTQHKGVDDYWMNYDEEDYDNAFCNMIWEWICE